MISRLLKWYWESNILNFKLFDPIVTMSIDVLNGWWKEYVYSILFLFYDALFHHSNVNEELLKEVTLT